MKLHKRQPRWERLTDTGVDGRKLTGGNTRKVTHGFHLPQREHPPKVQHPKPSRVDEDYCRRCGTWTPTGAACADCRVAA